MRRERPLKVVLVLVGLLFCAGVNPLMPVAKQDLALAMMLSLYVSRGIFLLLASRNPFRAPQLDRFHGLVEFCSRRPGSGEGRRSKRSTSMRWYARRSGGAYALASVRRPNCTCSRVFLGSPYCHTSLCN